MVDHGLTKGVILVPCSKSIDTNGITQLFFDHVFKCFGQHDSIISDCCKDGGMAWRTKGVRHTCPELLKGRGEARYFAPKGTQGKGGVGRKSKAKGISAGDSLGSDRSVRPEVRGAQDEENESGIW